MDIICFQSAIVYESIGVYPAQTFFEVNSVNGDVTIRTNLKDDNSARTDYTVSL